MIQRPLLATISSGNGAITYTRFCSANKETSQEPESLFRQSSASTAEKSITKTSIESLRKNSEDFLNRVRAVKKFAEMTRAQPFG